MILSILLFSILIYGFLFGLSYALISLGFTLVFGVSKILNLTYGALFMTTSYMIYLFAEIYSINLLASIAISILITILVGLAIFLVLSKFVIDPMVFMVSMLLFALLLQYLFSYFFGGQVGLIIPGAFPNSSISVLGVSVELSLIASAVISILLIAFVWLWIDRSSQGRKIRATSEDIEVAELFGVNTLRVNIIILMISILLISIAAILLVPSQVVTPTMWIDPFVIAFAVSIIGGLGKFKWVIPSAFIISFSQIASQYLIPYNVSDLVSFLIVIVFIIVLPNGIGGARHA